MWHEILTRGVSAEWGVFVNCACPRVHLGCLPLLTVFTWLHAVALEGAPVPMAMEIPDIDLSCREKLHQLWSSSVQHSPGKCCSSLGADVREVCVLPSPSGWDIIEIQLIFLQLVAWLHLLSFWNDSWDVLFISGLVLTHGPSPALEFMEVVGERSVCDGCACSLYCSCSFSFFVTLGSPGPRYLVLLRRAASPLLKIT